MRNKRIAWWNSEISKREHFESKLQNGVKIRLHFDSQLSRLIYCEGFELQERKFLNAFLRPGDIFVDIGANIGLFSLIAARCVGKNGHVYAFEPTAKIYQRLIENVNLNHFKNISYFQLALSDT